MVKGMMFAFNVWLKEVEAKEEEDEEEEKEGGGCEEGKTVQSRLPPEVLVSVASSEAEGWLVWK